MKRFYHTGQKVRLSAAARENENYAAYLDAILIITSWADHYAPSGADGPGGHPGYDDAMECPLYDFAGCPFSLYEFEIESI